MDFIFYASYRIFHRLFGYQSLVVLGTSGFISPISALTLIGFKMVGLLGRPICIALMHPLKQMILGCWIFAFIFGILLWHYSTNHRAEVIISEWNNKNVPELKLGLTLIAFNAIPWIIVAYISGIAHV